MIKQVKDILVGWLENFEKFTLDVIYSQREGPYITLYKCLLMGLSKIFSILVQIRFLLYKNRILHDQHLGCLVVVVGNLTVGGTGKTPVVEIFARHLAERGRTVAILSRGYKSKNEHVLKKWWRMISHGEPPPPKIVSDGRRLILDSEMAGDEPYMLAKNLPGVLVIVDKNRVKAGIFAIKNFGVDTLILDDGFQYLALKEQLNLLLIDKTNPFGNHHLLPRGILREPVKHIKRATYIFVTKSNGDTDHELEDIIHQHKPDAEIIECAHRPHYLQEVNGEERLELSALQGKCVGAISGIADPKSFESFLNDNGAQIKHYRRFLDHHRFSPRELKDFFEHAYEDNLDMVVTTEKDAVRIPLNHKPKVPFYYLRLEIEILSGVSDFDEAVSRICFPKKKMPATRTPFPN